MLVDVARNLFAKMGFENITMNDIAQASKKGRRTLYTYFKSKNDVYQAVIDTEMEKLQQMLVNVSVKQQPADEKLLTFLYTRLNAVKAIVVRNGSLRADFFRDIWDVERARKSFDIKETELIKDILDAGIEEGIFQIADTDSMARVIHYSLKGLEVPYIRGRFGDTISKKNQLRLNIENMIFNGIRIKTDNPN